MSLTEPQLRDALNERWPGRDWSGLCQAVMRNASELTGGYAGGAYLTASAAYRASRIESLDPTRAPIGAVHYWHLPDEPDGHVALDLSGSATRMLHGFTVLEERWGTNLGVVSMSALRRSRPAWSYLGWSLRNGANLIDLTPPTPAPVEEDLVDYQYIYSGARWALIHPLLIVGGVLVTTSQQVALGWEDALGLAKSAREVPAARWDRAVQAARDAAAAAQQAYPAGTAHADPEVRRLLEELVAATGAPRTITVG